MKCSANHIIQSRTNKGMDNHSTKQSRKILSPAAFSPRILCLPWRLRDEVVELFLCHRGCAPERCQSSIRGFHISNIVSCLNQNLDMQAANQG